MNNFKIVASLLVSLLTFTACNNNCSHDFLEHDYSKDLVGTWSVIGPDAAEALEIMDDGSMKLTAVHEGEFFETTASYELSNNHITITWEDGFVDEGRLDVVEGCALSIVIDEESGAGYFFVYCHENLSDDLIGSWLLQSDETSEIHTYYTDGTSDCVAYYYHLEESFETFVSGTYKVVGDILFETVTYGEDTKLSFASRIAYTPSGSPFGDVMTSTSLYLQEDELIEEVGSVVRVKPSLELAGKKYNYADCQVCNVKGEDMEIEFMGHKFNIAKMDGSGLDVMLKTLFFNMEFQNADTLYYSYQYNNNKERFDVPIVVENNKMTIKMSNKVPTLKDVVLYAFQSVDGSQLHFSMDKPAFVSFYTNMQALLMESTDEQFDIANADAVNTIYNNIDNAVETIKLSIMME